MALIHIAFFSETLGMQAGCDVVLPQKAVGQVGMASGTRGGEHPVLWLLHGGTDDQTTWQRRTSIERYAAPLGLAVVMPSVQLSSYANMVHGGRYFDFVAQELRQKMREFFPLSQKREENYIAGNSMGGSGALKIGLSHPEAYGAIGCLSAAMPNHSPFIHQPHMKARKEMLYGGRDITGTEEDAVASALRILEDGLPRPRVYHAWGLDDRGRPGAEETRRFFESLEGNPFDYTCAPDPGDHTWAFWDEHIQDFLRFVGLRPLEGITN